MSARSMDEETIFCEALEHSSTEARAAYLDEACRGDADLRRRVEGLLQIRSAHASFLADPASFSGMPVREVPDADFDGSGAVIGPYKLLERIGEGGFGSVYMAEQHQPVQRNVALKVIKPGMDTRQVITRFEAERQALAMMDHPNIARVLDGGATDAQSPLGAGRPYFVMELVKGVPITRFCDEQRLGLRDRLALFMDACHAVQHAHQKGVIHRDIKPSNVLVSRYDDKPVVKIIDFGIAKAVEGRLTDKTLFTEFHQLIGTPAYMSPEQAGRSDLDVDTRSDIYSLGVLLYELLTGTTPFESQRLRSAGFDELRRIIREEEPPRPSTRVSSLGLAWRTSAREQFSPRSEPRASASGPLPHVRGSDCARGSDEGPRGDAAGAASSSGVEIASCRRSDPDLLVRLLRRDLDWIVMKCLEKDRTRRYETANGLAEDVQRYLSGEPVVAAPPSRVYRVRKFVRRNRAVVTAATLVAAALALGMAGTTFGLLRAEQRRAEADAAREQTQQVSDFQASMLQGIDVEAMGRGIKEQLREQVRAALEREYVGEIPDRRQRTPEEVEAELAAYDERADPAQAVDVARRVMDEFVLGRAADKLEGRFADQPLVRAQLHHALGRTYEQLNLYAAAEPHLSAALDIYHRELGNDHPNTLSSFNNMGHLLSQQGKAAEAEPYYRTALEGHRRVRGDDHPNTLTSIANMGALLLEQGKGAEAEPYYREALERRRRVLGDDHPATLEAINGMGYWFERQHRLSEAESYFRDALEGRRRVLGDDHRDTLSSINNVGHVLRRQGRLTEAEPYLREALEACRRVLGDEHRDTLRSINNLGLLLGEQDKLAEAEPYRREALEGSRRVLGDEHPYTLLSMINMGRLLERQGKMAEAEPYFREALEKSQRNRGGEATITLIHNMGFVLSQLGRYAEAETYYRKAWELSRRAQGDDHPDLLPSIAAMCNVLREQGKLTEAEPFCSELLERARRVLPDEHPGTLKSINSMGVLRLRQGRLREAEPYFREALEIGRRALSEEHPDTLAVMHNLGCVLEGLGDPTHAEPYLREALESRQRVRGEQHPHTLVSINDLGQLLLRQGRLDEAEPYILSALEGRQRVLGADHPDTLKSIQLMGELLEAQGSPSDAEMHYREALDGLRRILGDGHPGTHEALEKTSRCLSALGSPEDAENLYRNFVEGLRQQVPESDAALGTAMGSFGHLLIEHERYEEAAPLLRQSLEIREQTLHPESVHYWLNAQTRSLLGCALVGRGVAMASSNPQQAVELFTEAEPLILDSYEWLNTHFEQIDPSLPEALRNQRVGEAKERVLQLYDAWHAAEPDAGHEADAAAWRAELEQQAEP